MKICFPVQKDEGFSSAVYNHFGSAPLFLIVDTDTNNLASIDNRDQHHSHGACNPMKALDNQKVDAIIVGGIGAGALTGLNQHYRIRSLTPQQAAGNALTPEFIAGFDSQGRCLSPAGYRESEVGHPIA